MNPTQSQIIDWFNIANESNLNPEIDFLISGFTNNPKTYIKYFLIDLKSHVERWDLIMDYLFIHPTNYDFFISHLGLEELEFDINDYAVIWGTKIIATAFIPPDKVLGYTKLDGDQKEGINIVIGNMNPYLIDRLNKLRAFW